MWKSLTVPATVIESSPSATQYSPLLNEGQEKSSSTILINIGIKLTSSSLELKNMFCKMLRLLLLIYYILFSTSVFSKEIPIIVIAPSKKPQSISTVLTGTATISHLELNVKYLENPTLGQTDTEKLQNLFGHIVEYV